MNAELPRRKYIRRAPMVGDSRATQAAVLELLQAGPQRVTWLAQQIQGTEYQVYQALDRLKRQVKRILPPGMWALTSYVEPCYAAPAARVSEQVLGEPVAKVIHGVVYESIWAGKDPLPGSGAAQGLGATLSGSSFKAHV